MVAVTLEILTVQATEVAVDDCHLCNQASPCLCQPDEVPSCTMQCSEPVICRCLNVGMDEVHRAVALFGAADVREVGVLTGAGTGCTCCHRLIERTIANARQSLAAAPICSAR